MAVIENRVKDYSQTRGLLALYKKLIARPLLVILTMIIALILIYSKSNQRLSAATLEASGDVLVSASAFYGSFVNAINFIQDKASYLRDLKEENAQLKSELEHFRKIFIDLSKLEAENNNLKQLLNVATQPQYNYITARLLSVHFNPFSKMAIIGAGQNHGVELNQIVANEEGLIGRIIEVSNNYSKVMLVSDSNSRIPIITAISGERGILLGNNVDANIIYLRENHEVKLNEPVLTSGDGKIYPQGIPVGYVKEVNKNEVAVSQIANLHKTHFVQIYFIAQ